MFDVHVKPLSRPHKNDQDGELGQYPLAAPWEGTEARKRITSRGSAVSTVATKFVPKVMIAKL